jgi:tetratricopeptide (TPR) repeat protein
LSLGGDSTQARKARDHLEKVEAGGMRAALARGLDDSLHGRLKSAPDHFLNVVKQAHHSEDANAPLFSWFAAQRAVQLRDASPGLWQRWSTFVIAALSKPDRLGWRTRDVLLDWWVAEQWKQASKDLPERAREHYGCLKELRIAGPFGDNVAADTYRSFAAEGPGPWPARWEHNAANTAKILRTKRNGCSVRADEPAPNGIFYLETYLQVPQARDVIVVAPGAYGVWVNDHRVLTRDIRVWGDGLHAGVALRLPAGTHRLVAKTSSKEASLRVLALDGTPAAIPSTLEPSSSYSSERPTVLPDPNVLIQYVRGGNVIPPKDDVVRFCAASLAQGDRHADVASVLHEPLISSMDKATGTALHIASLYVENDPIFDTSQTSDLMRELNQRALKKDAGLWAAELDLISRTANNKGLTDAVKDLDKLQKRFPQVPGIAIALANVYGQLGWRAEYAHTAKALARQYPESLEALQSALEVYQEQGDRNSVDHLTARIRTLDPDSEILITQALEREDYDTALAQLQQLAKRRPERKALQQRIDELSIRAGKKQDNVERLKALIDDDPTNTSLHLAHADWALAHGDAGALHKQVATAVALGADQGPIVDAIDLVEGMTELQPYRLDARTVIAEYERQGRHLAGTAARVLDYAVVWVRADGSSRMLEHEIVRIQSAEAISRFAEQRLEGLILNMRVIKSDGRMLEPEPVEGKPSMTFPHLEVGDYLETEQIQFQRGDLSGRQYDGPRWFFREENVAYAHSELVVISPTHQPLQIETQGILPAPVISQEGQFVVRRWRVDHSPAAPDEPFSAPITEFLPSVSVGWGASLQRNLEALNARVSPTIPIDPRITKIAHHIVEEVPRRNIAGRARALYRWVQANVAEGEESDGRRVVVGKSGNRWQAMIALCRALGISANFVVARNRLASPIRGPLSEARAYGSAVLKIDAPSGPIWLTLDDKYGPFGYLPAELRGMPGFQLGLAKPQPVTLPNDGAQDTIFQEVDAKLATDGSAELKLVQTFQGKPAVQLRKGLAELPENRLHDVLETQLLGRTFHGARLKKFKIVRQGDADTPLAIEMTASVPALAQSRGNQLTLSPPYTVNLSQVLTVPVRQTPLLIMETTHQVVRMRVTPPQGATIAAPTTLQLDHAGYQLRVADRLDKGILLLDREILIPAGRVQPDAYAAFVDFARQSDAAQARDIVINLK